MRAGRLARRRFVQLGTGENRRTLVFDEDVAAAAIACANAASAASKVYNVTDGRVHAMRDIVAAICAGLGRKPPRLQIPVSPVRMIARTMETVGSAANIRLPIRSATIDKYLEDVAIVGERIRADLNWEPQVDILSGWRETIAGLRRTGELK